MPTGKGQRQLIDGHLSGGQGIGGVPGQALRQCQGQPATIYVISSLDQQVVIASVLSTMAAQLAEEIGSSGGRPSPEMAATRSSFVVAQRTVAGARS
ncbi:hypothetical protein BaRGS_00000001 [Batillaria attramentaria]|uniref:Uncharacterized protein n=1 Tax=Batillaria attramentaria TaxID=370345 RepID=A0ABD0M9X1_9CAEN